MPRTLGPIVQDQQELQYGSQSIDEQNSENLEQQQLSQQLQNDQQYQPFYLSDKLPMFLAQGASGKNNSNVNNSVSVNKDIDNCKHLIQNLCNNQIKTKQQLDQLAGSVSNTQDLSLGMGFFAAKNMIFLEYLMLLKLYQLYKINGTSLTQGNGLELYKRLAYLKTVLLKLAPVQKKLQYQKNKILKYSERVSIKKEKKQQDQINEEQAEQQDQNQNQMDQQNENQASQNQQEDENKIQEDQMAFKPRPMSLLKIKQEKDSKILSNSKYQAPKISSNLSKQQKLKQHMQKQKQRRRLNLIRRLQSDLVTDTGHAEQEYLGDKTSQKLKKRFQQKIAYEEQAFVRLPDNKKDKFYKKQLVRNSMRKNQLQQDYKQIQMVRKLFDDQDKAIQMNKSFSKNKNSRQQHKGQTHTNKNKFNNKDKSHSKKESGNKTKKIGKNRN